MPAVTFFNFLKKIETKQEKFPLSILYGFSEFLGEKIIQAFVDNFIEKKSDFNYRRYYFDAENETGWEEIINEANSSSFFIQSRKVIVAVIREEKRISLSKVDKDILWNYLKNPNQNTILIIYFSLSLSKDDFNQVKRSKINRFLDEFKSSEFYSINLDSVSIREVKDYIKYYLKKRGISITSSALEKMVELKGDDFASILHQLPCLEIAEKESESIDSEDVDKILTGIEAHSIWDLTDAIESEDANRYLKVLKYLFINGVKPALIIGTLINHYNKIYTAKFLLKHNFPVHDIGKVLQQPSFILEKFIRSVRNFSERRLHQILEIVYRLDFESKTSGEDSARLSLQNFIFQIKLLTSTR